MHALKSELFTMIYQALKLIYRTGGIFEVVHLGPFCSTGQGNFSFEVGL